MKRQAEDSFYIGYKQGYVAGYQAGAADKELGYCKKNIENDISKLPIEAMTISTRARTCLHTLGCVLVEDVIALPAEALARARKLGPKTARQIACWLDENGFPYSAWTAYL